VEWACWGQRPLLSPQTAAGVGSRQGRERFPGPKIALEYWLIDDGNAGRARRRKAREALRMANRRAQLRRAEGEGGKRKIDGRGGGCFLCCDLVVSFTRDHTRPLLLAAVACDAMQWLETWPGDKARRARVGQVSRRSRSRVSVRRLLAGCYGLAE
jgi:hypothetical protein